MVFDIAILICEHRRATHIERFADVFSFKLLAGQRCPTKTDDHEAGTSLNVLQRQADGRWLSRICSLNEA